MKQATLWQDLSPSSPSFLLVSPPPSLAPSPTLHLPRFTLHVSTLPKKRNPTITDQVAK